jgi:hypothetical protein
MIGQIKSDNFSVSRSLKAVFLSMDTKIDNNTNRFLAQNEITGNISDSNVTDSLDDQDELDTSVLNLKENKTFQQCSSAGNIYSDDELNENLQELKG